MAKSVVVKHGRDTYEFTYSDYNDYNNPLNRIESQYAGKMVERVNGKVMRDLKTAVTETGSVYVVVPVPPSVSGGPTPAPADVRQRPETAGAHVHRRDAAFGRRQAQPDRQLEKRQQVLHLALRQPPLRTDPARRLQRGVESDARFRVRGGSALRARIARSTSPRTGTRSSISTCGRTRKTPS